jgi:hypothetical protein
MFIFHACKCIAFTTLYSFRASKFLTKRFLLASNKPSSALKEVFLYIFFAFALNLIHC